ncbi:thioredoxin reductase [Westerdykella ornata]|uniref:Thioredoxin reductase n=1 Tax=Westerdykella ornata TaxID=318751 RepID=A0A6A6JS06_WESOR|nr:thioredoxin reductase [Westerdykella ornata]KAF2278516.1 thioredoxin reductase [Westerdykella ornata]
MSLKTTIVASFAESLNAADIPCVLWGHCLLNVHGVPSIVGSIDFVIPDGCLQTAVNALSSNERLTQCERGELCPISSPEGFTPPPAFHMHLDASDLAVGLYLQSEMIWFLPSLDTALSSPQQDELPAYFVLASDETVLPPYRLGMGSGALPQGGHLVLVPTSVVLLEAYLRLWARDWRKRQGGMGIAMIAYMQEYVEKEGFLDGDQLPEPLRTFYRELKEGEKPVRQWSEELSMALGVSDEGDEEEDCA